MTIYPTLSCYARSPKEIIKTLFSAVLYFPRDAHSKPFERYFAIALSKSSYDPITGRRWVDGQSFPMDDRGGVYYTITIIIICRIICVARSVVYHKRSEKDRNNFVMTNGLTRSRYRSDENDRPHRSMYKTIQTQQSDYCVRYRRKMTLYLWTITSLRICSTYICYRKWWWWWWLDILLRTTGQLGLIMKYCLFCVRIYII